tara:strand:- start:1873 stop:3108 length:1236 start_codon:yes stop_codon:yes gene_type:complete
MHPFVIFLLASSQPPDTHRRVEEEVAPLRAAIQLSPHSADAYSALASAYERHRFMRAASEVLESAVGLSPEEGALYRRLGSAYFAMRDSPAAIRAHETAIRLDPTDARAHLALSHALSPADPRKEQALREAWRLDGSSAPTAAMLASLLTRAGRRDEALPVLERLAVLSPYIGGRRLLDHYKSEGRAAAAMGAYAKAVGYLSLQETPPPEGPLAEWDAYASDVESRLSDYPPKCLTRECVAGLEEALGEDAAACAELALPEWEPPHVAAAMREGSPLLIRRAIREWTPFREWDGDYLESRAGHGAIEVAGIRFFSPHPPIEPICRTPLFPYLTFYSCFLKVFFVFAHPVVPERESFEVFPDRMERPPKTEMRLRDLIRLLRTKRDLGITLYSRQVCFFSHSKSLTRRILPI